MKKLFFSIFILSLMVFPALCLAQNQEGLVSEVALAPISMAPVLISTSVIAMVIALFVLIPASFIGALIRLIGYRKDSNSQGWKFDLKLALVKFFKYLVYHFLLIFIWSNFIGFQEFSPNVFRQTGLFDSLFILISSNYILFIIYVLIWAVAGPFIVYGYNKLRKKKSFKPSIAQIIRLLVWNVVFFMVVSAIFVFIFTDFGGFTSPEYERDYSSYPTFDSQDPNFMQR